MRAYTALGMRSPNTLLILPLVRPAKFAPEDELRVMPVHAVGMPLEAASCLHGCALASADAAFHLRLFSRPAHSFVLFVPLITGSRCIRDAAAAPAVAPVVSSLEVGYDLLRCAFEYASPPIAAYVVLGGGVAGNLCMYALEMLPELMRLSPLPAFGPRTRYRNFMRVGTRVLVRPFVVRLAPLPLLLRRSIDVRRGAAYVDAHVDQRCLFNEESWVNA